MLRRFFALIGALLMLSACAPPSDTDAVPTEFILETPTQAAESALVPVSREPVPMLDFWEPVNGTLTAEDPVDTWAFMGQAGDEVRVRALGAELTLLLRLRDPDGLLIEEGESLRTQLTQSGEYRVEVALAEGSPSGDYQLGLSYADQVNPTENALTPLPAVVGVPTPLPVYVDLGAFIAPLDHAVTVGGSFTETSMEHVYTYEGRAGRYLTVSLSRVSGDFLPRLTLYDPQGMPVALDGGSGNNGAALLRDIPMQTDGVYTVQASSGGVEGVYSVLLYDNEALTPVTPFAIVTRTLTPQLPALTPTIATAVPGERLESHVPVIGTLDDPEGLARHTFEAVQGEIVTFGVEPQPDSGLIPRVELVDPEGVPVAVVEVAGSPTDRRAVISTFTVQMSGPHTAFVTAQGSSFGDYLVAYGTGSTYRDVMRGEAQVDRPNESAVEQATARDVWYTYLRAGDLVSASVVPLEGTLDPILEIAAEDGRLIGIDRESAGARSPQINGVRIWSNGVYRFRVRSFSGQQTGRYALIWRYLDVAPTPTPPEGVVPLLSLRDVVEDSAYQFYPFYGQAGQRVRIRIVAQPEDPFDPVAALLGPGAELIAEADDTDGDLNPTFTVTLPEDGTYSVRVNGYLAGGAFTLLVEALY